MVRTFSYKQIEPVLAQVLGVRPENLASLAARIMHEKARPHTDKARPGRADRLLAPRPFALGVIPAARAHVARAGGGAQSRRTNMDGHGGGLTRVRERTSGRLARLHFPRHDRAAARPAEENQRTSFVAGLASDFEAFQAQYLSLVVLQLSALRRAVDAAIDEIADAAAPRRGIRRELAGRPNDRAPQSPPAPRSPSAPRSHRAPGPQEASRRDGVSRSPPMAGGAPTRLRDSCRGPALKARAPC